jgi:hypothetical protein
MKDLKFFIIVSVVAILFGIPIGTASAAPHMSCSGWDCNNLWPEDEGCSAVTANAAWKWSPPGGSGLVRADLRWSTGCYANWSRVTNESPYAVRRLRAHLTDSAGVNRVAAVENSQYAQIWTTMYDGSYYNCAGGKQGFVGYAFDAVTVLACG